MMAAFDIYTRLAASGEVHKLDVPLYWEDEEIAGQVEIYARHVKCVLVTDADTLYLFRQPSIRRSTSVMNSSRRPI